MLLVSLGFEALATTSFWHGQRAERADGEGAVFTRGAPTRVAG
jgi:hypothetical protein